MSGSKSNPKDILDELLRSHGFNEETRFYRQTLPEFLTPTDEAGVFRISANDDPSEAIVDVYADGHIGLAQQMGPGLAFAQSVDNEWSSSERTTVEVLLQHVLAQGGRIYSVESVITEPVWYFTLPEGWVQVRELQ